MIEKCWTHNGQIIHDMHIYIYIYSCVYTLNLNKIVELVTQAPTNIQLLLYNTGQQFSVLNGPLKEIFCNWRAWLHAHLYPIPTSTEMCSIHGKLFIHLKHHMDNQLQSLYSDIGNSFNSLRPRQNRRHFADYTFKRIFMNENFRISINISLKFIP